MMTLRDEFDRLFDDRVAWPRSEWQMPGWGLDLDVAENEENFVVKASLPGINPDDLDVTVTDNVLTIKGEVKSDETIKEEQYHLRERRFGSFSRSVTLPVSVNTDQVEATYENGVLTLQLPKTEEHKPKRIGIKGQADGRKTIEGRVVQGQNK
jgi:HSP20 family protein